MDGSQEFQDPQIMSSTKETVSGTPTRKTVRKSKYNALYEALLKGEQPYQSNENFWDELFLLKTNKSFLSSAMDSVNFLQPHAPQENISLIIRHATDAVYDANETRVGYAMETINLVFQSLLKNYSTSDVLDIACKKNREDIFHKIISRTQYYLESPSASVPMQSLCIRLLLTFVSIFDSKSTLRCFFEEHNMLTSIIAFLKTSQGSTDKINLELEILTFLSILTSYSVEENTSRIISDIQKLTYSDSKILESVFSRLLTSRILIENPLKNQTSNSWFGFLFKATTTKPESNRRANHSFYTGAIILCLYTLCYQSKRFLECLFFSTPILNDEAETIVDMKRQRISDVVIKLVELSYCIGHECNDKYKSYHHLIMTILLIFVENSDTLHVLHQTPPMLLYTDMPHLRYHLDKNAKPSVFVYWILDHVLRTIRFNMKKSINVELVIKCFEIIHRVLCFLKKMRFKLELKWKHVWLSIIKFSKFLSQKDSSGSYPCQEQDTLICSKHVFLLLNMFITFGDCFLPQPEDYDDLFYDFMRDSVALSNYISYLEEIDLSGAYTSDMYNMKTILNHFSEKLEHYQASNPGAQISDKMVLEIIKNNYETLKLKLQDSLDKFDSYGECENQKALTWVQRTISSDLRSCKEQ